MNTDEKANDFSLQAKYHMDLRRKITKQNPKVRELSGADPVSFFFVLGLFLVHWAIVYYLRDSSVLMLFFAAATVGQLLFHSQGSLLHEAAHHLIFATEPLATVSELLIELTFTSFGQSLCYCQEHSRQHHPYLGDYPRDNEIPDLCTHFLGVQLKSKNPNAARLLFLIRCIFALIPLSFLFEPLLLSILNKYFLADLVPADASRIYKYPTKVKVKIVIFQICSGLSLFAVGYFLGWRSLFYHLLCISFESNKILSIWRLGQNIAEHNTDNDEQPTNSTYNFLFNFLFFNTGYHNEHHTFPTIPWRRLPELKKLANDDFSTVLDTPYYKLYWENLKSHFESYRLSRHQTGKMQTHCQNSKKAQ